MNGHLVNPTDVAVKLISSLEPIKLWFPTNLETNLTEFQRLIEQKYNLKYGKCLKFFFFFLFL